MVPGHHLGAVNRQGVTVQENEFAVRKEIRNDEETIVKFDWVLQQQPGQLINLFALLSDELL